MSQQLVAVRPRRVLDPCVECGDEVTPHRTAPDIVQCGSCGFMIEIAEAARIRARVEGAAS